MPQLPNKHLKGLEGNGPPTEERVRSSDVRFRFRRWKTDGASDAIEFDSNHLLEGNKIAIPLVDLLPGDRLFSSHVLGDLGGREESLDALNRCASDLRNVRAVRRLSGRVTEIVDINLEEFCWVIRAGSQRDVRDLHLVLHFVMREVGVVVNKMLGEVSRGFRHRAEEGWTLDPPHLDCCRDN